MSITSEQSNGPGATRAKTTALANTSGHGSPAADKIFSGISLAAGVLILVVLVAVAIFLVAMASDTFTADPAELTGGKGFASYIWPLVVGTLIAATIALLLATPVGIGVALFISHFIQR